MSTAYLLDANVVIHFQRSGALDVLAASTLRLVVVEEVWDELTAPRNTSHRTAAAEVKRVLEPAVSVESIGVGSSAGRALTALRGSNMSRTNLGEDASTALAMFATDLVLVTDEQRAAFRALNELRGRVIVAHPFLRLLVEKGDLDRQRASTIANDLVELGRSSRPSWWDAWTIADGPAGP